MTNPKGDLVTGLTHYVNHKSGVECWNIVEWQSFNVGCAVKYMWRRKDKNSEIEDLKKAANYLRRELEHNYLAYPQHVPEQYWRDVLTWHTTEPAGNIRTAMYILMHLKFDPDKRGSIKEAKALIEDELAVLCGD